MNMTTSYLILALAVFLGVTSNSFAKSAEGFTLFIPSVISGITIVLCTVSYTHLTLPTTYEV